MMVISVGRNVFWQIVLNIIFILFCYSDPIIDIDLIDTKG